MTLMTEAEAWAFLADKWENYTTWCGLPAIQLTDDNLPTTCLCHNVGSLEGMHMISATTANNMQDVINEHLQLTGNLAYGWRRNHEGAVERAKFCRKQVELLNPLTPYEKTCVRHVTIPHAHALLTLQINSNTDGENYTITDSGNTPVEFVIPSIVKVSSSIQNSPNEYRIVEWRTGKLLIKTSCLY